MEFLILAVMTHSPLYAQNGELFNINTITAPSVDSWAMDKRSITEPFHYTGTMAWSQPLVRYSDPDFDVPVTLYYSYGGYRPCLHSGNVGLGWSLDCGGIITRDIRGLADEQYFDDDNAAGYWFTTQTSSVYSNQLISKSAVHPLSYSFDRDPMYVSSFKDVPVFPNHIMTNNDDFSPLKYDACPDIFHYSMFGHHGDFVLKPDGNVAVFNSDQPRGEVAISMNVDRNGIPTFVVSTGDGYEYYFGGVEEAYEWSAAFPSSTALDTDFWPKSISAIRLKRVVAPNGRELTFTFSDEWQLEATASVSYTDAVSARGLAGFNGDSYSNWNTGSSKETWIICSYHTLTKSIDVDGWQAVRLSYQDREAQEFVSGSFIDSNNGVLTDANVTELAGHSCSEKKLSSVALYDKEGNCVDRTDLSYFHSSQHGTPKMFLEEICSMRAGTFSFSYNADENTVFPKMDTQAVDFWGFWNGHEVYDLRYSTFTNIANCSTLYDQFASSWIKNADSRYSVKGSLKRVVFPTGGAEIINYEGNRVGRRIDCPGTIIPYLSSQLSEDYDVGGIRVREIQMLDKDGELKDFRRFYYQNEDNHTSSGELLQMPRYAVGLSYTMRTEFYLYEIQTYMYSKDLLGFLTRKGHIGYSRIREEYPDGSSVAKTFANYSLFPDLFHLCDDPGVRAFEIRWLDDPMSPSWESGENRHLLEHNFCTMMSSDRSFFRGRLLRQDWYDEDENITRSVEYEYGINTVVSVNNAINAMFAFAMFPYSCDESYLESMLDTRYETSGCVTTRVRNTYNDMGQIASTAREGGPETNTITEYRCYCHEADSMSVSGLSRYPSAIYSSTTFASSVNGYQKQTGRIVYSYDRSSKNPWPCSAVETRDGNGRSTLFYYDRNFRPRMITSPGGGHWSRYTWSLDGRYMLSMTEDDDCNTTYFTWRDLVGVSSVTTPTGQVEMYNYDDKGRLVDRINTDGVKTVSYEYNIVNE